MCTLNLRYPKKIIIKYKFKTNTTKYLYQNSIKTTSMGRSERKPSNICAK